MIAGCDHIGIQVRDVDLSARFYVERLGFEPVSRFARSEPYVQRVVGCPDGVRLEIAVLRIPGSETFLEILEYRGAAGVPVDPATVNPGTAHFCLFVDGLEDLYRRLLAEGVEFVSGLEVPTAGPNKGGKLVYLKDPDGIRVELVETDRRSDDSLRSGRTDAP